MASKPIPLQITVQPNNRHWDYRLDSQLINCLMEKDIYGDVWVRGRPQIVCNFQPTIPSANPQGLYYWANVQQLMYITGGQLTGSTGWTSYGTGLSVAANYWFNETLGSTPYLYMSNGFQGWYLSSTSGSPTGTVTQITDATYTAIGGGLTVPGSAFLDGTLYVGDAAGNIWGTANLNNPIVWSATNVIKAQNYSDRMVAIARQNIYVLALKQWSCEAFYDAANATGSPLSPVPNTYQPYGCFNGYTVRSIDDVLFWVGQTRAAGPIVLQMKALQTTRISTPPIERILQFCRPTKAFSMRLMGHTYYMIQCDNVSNSITNPPPSCTLIYDIEQRFWYIWQANGAALPFVAGDLNGFSGSVGGGFGQSTFLDSTNGQYYYSFVDSVQLYPSAGDSIRSVTANTPLQFDIYSNNWDNGTRFLKTFLSMKFFADQYHNTGVAVSYNDSIQPVVLLVRWSDDDYISWSPFIPVRLDNQEPVLTDMGSARRRAFNFRAFQPGVLRMKGIEMEVDLGTA